ncbi:MAG: CHAT domain-containing protein [Caulobacterales bacterium]|nr:CHAT domain-containing protein [Caulobacterales bacterium]
MLICAMAGSAAAGTPRTLPRDPTPKEAAAWKALVAQAETAQAVGDWARLEQVTRKRAAIEERTFGLEAPVTAASYSWIGLALSRRGRDAEAEPFYRRALEIDRKALGETQGQTLLATNNLAGVLERQRRFAEAEPLRRALLVSACAAFGEKSAEAAAAAAALGDVLRAQGRAREAEPLYRQALETDAATASEADPRVAADLGALAVVLDALGRHVEAEPLHRRSLAIRLKAFGERDAATAQAYARMGANLDAQGRHAEAEPLYRAALATDRQVRGERHPTTAADLADLGANLTAQGRTKDAEPLLRQALEIRRRALGERDPETAASYAEVAATLAARGKAGEAERLHRRALETLRAAKGDRDPATADAEIALAADLMALNRAKDAEPLLRNALEVRRAALGEAHPATARAYDALAENQHRLAADGDAEQLAGKAVAIVRARRAADQRAAGSDPDAALRRARAGAVEDADAPIFRRYLRMAWLAARARPAEAQRLRDAAFSAAQELQVSPAAQALAQTAARAALGRKPAAGEARVQQALAGQARQIEGQLLEALPSGNADRAASIGVALDAVGRELAGLDARLASENPLYAAMLAPAPLSLAQAQRRLRRGEGLLLIVPADGDVYVFAASRTKSAWTRIVGGEAELERRIRVLRCSVDDGTCAGKAPISADGASPYDLATAYSLYRDLISPVEDALDGAGQLFVTASGRFGGLPLALLPTAPPAPGQHGTKALAETPWLADRYALTTLPSIASLRAMPPPARPQAQRWAFIGFGDPILGGAGAGQRRPSPRTASEGRPLADPRVLNAAFSPLPGTADELRAMARALGAPSSSLRIGSRATETAIKTSAELGKAGVVLFATHGLLSREAPGVKEPGLVLTPPAKPTSEDDGVLTASEAAELDLSADWVILSACNTAGSDGEPGADNLSGLARAFLYAGAHALLVSHWRVFDDSTAALTVQTLALQKAHPRMGKAQALQLAMREVRSGRRADGTPLPGWKPQWAHPAYWAPFVLIDAGE